MTSDEPSREAFFTDYQKHLSPTPNEADQAKVVQVLSKKFSSSAFLQNRAFGEGTETAKKEIEDLAARPDYTNVKRLDQLQKLLELDYAHTEKGDSIYGPAAYAYDLLRIALSLVAVSNEELRILTRRPDFVDIALSPENTDKALPYIEIINYILARQLIPYKKEFFEQEGTPTGERGKRIKGRRRRILTRIGRLNFFREGKRKGFMLVATSEKVANPLTKISVRPKPKTAG